MNAVEVALRGCTLLSMSPDEMRSPVGDRFRERFRDHPESAIITLRARGHLTKDGVCQLDGCKPAPAAGPHPALGGDASLECSGDLLLGALVACAGVTLGQIATAMEIELRNAVVSAEGEVDLRGSLALSDDVPIGLYSIRLHLDVDSDATDEQLETMVRLTERYCVVSRTLKPLTEVTFSSSANK